MVRWAATVEIIARATKNFMAVRQMIWESRLGAQSLRKAWLYTLSVHFYISPTIECAIIKDREVNQEYFSSWSSLPRIVSRGARNNSPVLRAACEIDTRDS
jgi:hypothetical protein